MRNGRYTIKFLPPIEVLRTGDMQHDLEADTRKFNEILEQIIREQPESWLWGHKRWKYQPPGNPQNLYDLSRTGTIGIFKNDSRFEIRDSRLKHTAQSRIWNLESGIMFNR